MVERTLEWGLFDGCPGVHYTAIDSLPANIAAATARLHALPPWFDLGLETADVFDFCTRAAEQAATTC